MGGSLLFKTEVLGSSLLGHLPTEFSLRLTWCPWLVGYYGTRGISRGARKLARTPSLSKKTKKKTPRIQSCLSIHVENLLIPIDEFEIKWVSHLYFIFESTTI